MHVWRALFDSGRARLPCLTQTELDRARLPMTCESLNSRLESNEEEEEKTAQFDHQSRSRNLASRARLIDLASLVRLETDSAAEDPSLKTSTRLEEASMQLPHPRTTFALQGYLAHKNPPLVGPYSSPMPRDLWWSWGDWVFLMSEVPLYTHNPLVAPRAVSVRARGLAFYEKLDLSSHSDVFPPLTDSGLGGKPRQQKMLKGHLPRVIYHQVY